MKVAVSSNRDNLDAQLEQRLGRCAFFLVVNTDDMSFEAFKNEGAVHGGDADIQAARFLASQGVEAVITGNCGPNVVQTLSTAGIELFGEQAGLVREVVKRFKSGNLKPTSDATVASHFGMNAEAGFGRGAGNGMSGLAGSRRMGGGTQFKGQELEGLKQQADSLNKKMKEVIARINS